MEPSSRGHLHCTWKLHAPLKGGAANGAGEVTCTASGSCTPPSQEGQLMEPARSPAQHLEAARPSQGCCSERAPRRPPLILPFTDNPGIVIPCCQIIRIKKCVDTRLTKALLFSLHW